LIISDLHFGKTGHFRKSGIAVPQGVYKEDLQRLVSQIQYFQPSQLIIVGDFFHSQLNKELELLANGGLIFLISISTLSKAITIFCTTTGTRSVISV